MRRPVALALLLTVHLFASAGGDELGPSANLHDPLDSASDATLLGDPGMSVEGILGSSETYSQAPIVEDSTTTYYLSDVAAPTLHTFDGLSESGGGNFFGSTGGFITVTEGVTPLGGGVDRYLVEVGARNSGGFLEPWVDASWAGFGLLNWRLDVGSTLGGIDPIQFAFPISVFGSGVTAFDSSGSSLGTFALTADTSTSTSLSGVAVLTNGGFDIAGVDVAALQMFWDVGAADLAMLEVDAANGAYLPSSPLDVFVGIGNLGGASSSETSFSLYASTDTTISGADRLLGNFIVPPLGPGDSIGANAQTAIPGDLANGDYYIGGILNFVDADGSNNSSYDPIPITVSTDPEVDIRPLTLDFAEEAMPSPSSSGDPIQSSVPNGINQSVLTRLRETAESKGSVRVIVGLEVPFVPEGDLLQNVRQTQRQQIQASSDQLLAELRGFTYQVNRRFRFVPFIALTVDAGALQRLAGLRMVKHIEKDSLSAPTLASSNQVIGTPLAWAEGFQGTGQTVAILDTGVDKTHSWFTTGGNKVVSEACYSSTTADSVSVCPGGVSSSTAPGSGVNCDVSVSGCDHGTHVAGISAGNNGVGPDFGVARGADLIAVQVFSQFDDPAICGNDPTPCVRTYKADQISGLERIYDLRGTFAIAAANMSLGGSQFFDQASCDAANGASKAAIDNLRSVNIATVIASGNAGFRDSIGEPGCISSAISVGATTDQDAVASFSNIYPQIHLLAPGVSITSSVPGGGTEAFQGTSQAAPHVAGAWAILKEVDPGASVTEILSILQSTATPIDDTRPGGIETGMPRINVDLAIGEPRTTFGIWNTGAAVLNISSISPESPAPWISWMPSAPFDVQPGQLQVITVQIDFASAPEGMSQTRLLVNSNDPNESPYPEGVFVNVTASPDSEPEFDSTPAAGSNFNFGDVDVGVTSTAEVLQVDNLGTADLTVGCALSGANADQFAITQCPTPVSPAGSVNVTFTCTPTSAGNKVASLDLTTNDDDETNVSYSLNCNGTMAGELEFSDGFEE